MTNRCSNCGKEYTKIKSKVGIFCSFSCFCKFKHEQHILNGGVVGRSLSPEHKKKLSIKRRELVSSGNFYRKPRIRYEQKLCPQCHLSFESKISANRVYCSQKCYHQSKKGLPTWSFGKTKETDVRVARQSKKLKETYLADGFCSKGFTGHTHSEFSKARIRNNSIKCWDEPEYRKKVFGGAKTFPNKAEKQLAKVLESIPENKFFYIGDGRQQIALKYPDFWDGKNKLIELFGDYWHKGDDPKDRIDYFKEFGYDCLIIWECELKDKKKLVGRIVQFAGQEGNEKETM